MAEPTRAETPPSADSTTAQADAGQPDDYTRLSNIVLEALVMARMPAGHMAITLHVIRQTVGWHREDAPASKRALAAATSINVRNIPEIVDELVAEGVLQRTSNGSRTEAARYKVQRNPLRWGKWSCLPPSLQAWHKKKAAERITEKGGDVQATTPARGGGAGATTPARGGGAGAATPPAGGDVGATTGGDVQATTGGDAYITTPARIPEVPQGPRASERKERQERQSSLLRAAAAELRLYLGVKSGAYDRFEAKFGPEPAYGLVGSYGPSPSDPRAGKLTEDRRREVLAATLDRFTAEAQAFNGSFFAGIFTSIANQGAAHDGAGAGSGNGRFSGRAHGQVAGQTASRRPTRYSSVASPGRAAEGFQG